MKDYQREFIEFAIEQDAIDFSGRTLNSGRKSPYFFNSAKFKTGRSLSKLSQAYAHATVNYNIEFEGVFGPAYKGIPLATSLATALYNHHGLDIPYTFDRKEEKDHGEGGIILGNEDLDGCKILLVDDVITSGKSVRDAVNLLKSFNAKVVRVLIALDRQEKGQGEKSTVRELEEDMGIKVTSIVGAKDIVEFLEEKGETQKVAAMKEYKAQYGC